MSTWIPNQPVYFGELNNDCSCDADAVAQLVDNTDSTQFQFSLEPCPNAQSVIEDTIFNDPAEWTLGDNWSISYNQLCLESGNLTGQEVVGQNVFVLGGYYQVNITVDSISDGSISVYIEGTLLGEIDTAGEYTFYGFASDLQISPSGLYRLLISNNDIDVSACISEITAYQIYNQFKFVVYDANNNSYQAQISYANNPDYFSFVEDSLTVTIDWGELGVSNGCYYVCLLDPCTNTNGQNIPISITNPNFTGNANGWTLGANWSYGANAVSYIAGAGSLSQTIFPTYSVFNRVTIEVTAITGDLNVYFGSVLMGTIQGIGTHIFNGTPYGGLDITLTPSAGGTGTVDSVTWNAPAFYEYTCDLQSNTFKLADYEDNCTMIINACNNEDGLGFIFNGSGFSPRLRLHAKLKQSAYASERNIYEDSLGTKRNVYYKRRKSKYLCIDLQPEYIHDFLSLAVGFDNLYIDGTSYFVEDEEYSVEYSDASDNLGKVKILVSEKTQKTTNINCSDVQNVCNLPPDYLLQADDSSQYITLTNGELILING